AQISRAIGHLVRTLQPDGGASGLGTSPVRTIRCALRPGTGSGIAESSATVYGCSGVSKRSLLGATSTILPRYMTAMRSEMYPTTARLCATNRYVSPRSRLTSTSRLSTWDWIDQAKPLTG